MEVRFMSLIKSYCPICNKETNHYTNGKCCSCLAKIAAQARKPEHFKAAEEIKRKNREILKESNPEEYKKRFCDKQTEWIRNLNPEEKTKRARKASKARSPEAIQETTRKLIAGNKRSWEEDNGSRANLSREIMKKNAKHEPYFSNRNGNLYYKGELWEQVKIRFSSKNFDKSIYDLASELGGIVQPTFRTEEFSFVGKSAMEQDIAEKNIRWFVYIKFIKEDQVIKPAVVGKTGSKLVCEESDISFDYDPFFDEEKNDLIKGSRPCRKYINETENCDWYKNAIIIIPCDSEKRAFKLEKEIHDKYDLFYS